MRTKVLGLYPNSPGLGPGRWGPIGRDESSYLTPKIDPLKSLTDPANNDMNKITPEMVCDRIKSLF